MPALERSGGGCRGKEVKAPFLALVQVSSLSRHARYGRLSRVLRGRSARSGYVKQILNTSVAAKVLERRATACRGRRERQRPPAIDEPTLTIGSPLPFAHSSSHSSSSEVQCPVGPRRPAGIQLEARPGFLSRQAVSSPDLELRFSRKQATRTRPVAVPPWVGRRDSSCHLVRPRGPKALAWWAGRRMRAGGRHRGVVFVPDFVTSRDVGRAVPTLSVLSSPLPCYFGCSRRGG